MFASIALASTSSILMDPKMIQAQVVLALVVSTSLMAGVYVARRSTARDGIRVINADADAL
jgi:hypothetical protein